MNQINLIGVSGQLQNGKDTVADLILKHTRVPETRTMYDNIYLAPVLYRDTEWKTRRFAGILKQMAALLIGCNISDFESDEFKNKELGEEWRIYPVLYIDRHETINKLFNTIEEREEWIESLSDSLCAHRRDSYILTPRQILQLLGTEGGRDIIHPNIWVNATLGNLKPEDKVIVTDVRFPNEVIGIKKRKGIVVRVIRPGKVSTSTHPSETSLVNYNDWDWVIINDGTLEELEKKVIEMLEHFNLVGINYHNQ